MTRLCRPPGEGRRAPPHRAPNIRDCGILQAISCSSAFRTNKRTYISGLDYSQYKYNPKQGNTYFHRLPYFVRITYYLRIYDMILDCIYIPCSSYVPIALVELPAVELHARKTAKPIAPPTMRQPPEEVQDV